MNKKKIAILTLHKANNYGAMYQAYALLAFLKKLGHEPFIVNYQMEAPSLWSYVRRPVAFFRKVVGKKALSFKFVATKLAERNGKKRENRFDEIFESFRRQHLKITETSYDYKKLVAECPDAEAFIVGSDQVWAADFVFSSPAFLLGFAPESVRKISYAASFGKGDLEPYLITEFRKFISRFDYVSVRERSGVALVQRISGVEAEHVLDPTLLLNDYSDLIDYSLVPQGQYVLTYRLGQDAQLSAWLTDSVKAISSARNLPVFSVSTNAAEGVEMVGRDLHPTPGQLLGLIEKSTFFVTNSFHGTVFALLLKADFLTFARDTAPDRQNLRMIELLSAIGLDSCYCSPFVDQAEVLKKASSEHNYHQARKVLNELCAGSSSFLQRALQ